MTWLTLEQPAQGKAKAVEGEEDSDSDSDFTSGDESSEDEDQDPNRRNKRRAWRSAWRAWRGEPHLSSKAGVVKLHNQKRKEGTWPACGGRICRIW